MAEVQEQMERLNAVRKKAEEVDREKSRISGELGTHKKRQQELSKKCKDEFECDIDELPKLVEGLNKQAEESLQQAEIVLGMREGTVKSEKKPEKKAAEKPVSKPEPKKSEIEEALDEEMDEDVDGLI